MLTRSHLPRLHVSVKTPLGERECHALRQRVLAERVHFLKVKGVHLAHSHWVLVDCVFEVRVPGAELGVFFVLKRHEIVLMNFKGTGLLELKFHFLQVRRHFRRRLGHHVTLNLS